MSYFMSEQEVYDTIGRLFKDLLDDDELGAKFRNADTVVQYLYHDPEAQITVELHSEGVRVDCGRSDLKPDITLSMDADTAHKFWLGKVNITVALARGLIKAKGPVTKILRLVPLTKPIYPHYQALLEKAGRKDLLKV